MVNSIAQLSPLYEYWNSDQCEVEEEKRKLKANIDSRASNLFLSEPYKWENLFQSIVNQIIIGDEDSIKGFNVLLDTLNLKERNILIDKIARDKIFEQDLLIKITNPDSVNSRESKKNLLRFLKILVSIFTNPYCIPIKRKKNHVYEVTGSFCFKLRQLNLFN